MGKFGICLLAALAIGGCKKNEGAARPAAPRDEVPPNVPNPPGEVAGGEKPCPAGSPFEGGASFEEMFGADIHPKVRCNSRKDRIKLVMQIDDYCRDVQVGGKFVTPETCPKDRALGLKNLQHIIDDYKITRGMADDDFEIAAVVLAGGAHLVRGSLGKTPNPWAQDIKKLQGQGVKFYLCLTTVEELTKKGIFTKGNLSSQVLEGLEFVPAALTAIQDFHDQGYVIVHPP